MRRNLFWLSNDQWQRIAPLLPTDVRGKERVDDRRVISGILHVLKSGCRWCDCPPDYGPPTTIYNRFVRWAERGVWERLFCELAARGRSGSSRKGFEHSRRNATHGRLADDSMFHNWFESYREIARHCHSL